MSDFQNSVLAKLALGKSTEYTGIYNAELLQAVPRSLNRHELEIHKQLPFTGVDVWHAYELSWLNVKGKPVVALARIIISAASPNIVESKSFKLYLNSFNQTRFESEQMVLETLHRDLANIIGAPLEIEFFQPRDLTSLAATELPGDCIDDLDISVDDYSLKSDILSVESPRVSETLHSHLLKSNCLITNQPDWASLIVSYHGRAINRESLLRYLISFREHNEFHEQCVERIFCDIQRHCEPDTLSVQALYTRRGGLDINPYRKTGSVTEAPLWRMNRQ